MSRDFNNSAIEQVYDDFDYRKADFDVALEDAVKDLEPVVEEAKKSRNKREVSDEMTAFIADFGDKIALGFNEASSAKRKELAPKLAQIYSSAILMNPQNTEDILAATDKLVKGYEGAANQDADVYNAFKKIYTTAIRNVRNQNIFKIVADRTNSLVSKIDILRGTGTPDKYLKRLLGDSPKAEDLQNFESSLKIQLKDNPEEAAKNVFGNIKDIVQIKDASLRQQTFEVMLQNLKKMLENSLKEARKSPEDLALVEHGMFKIFEIEKAVGLSEKADLNRTPFEKEMLGKKKKLDNKERLDKQILTLLNIPSKKLDVKRDPSKPFYPTKKEMSAVANLLTQYSKIDYGIATNIIGKIDKEKFSNIDDKIIDKIKEATPRIQYGTEITETLTSIRSQMHSSGVQTKKEATKTVDMKKSKEDTAKAPTNRIVFNIKDIPNSGMDGK